LANAKVTVNLYGLEKKLGKGNLRAAKLVTANQMMMDMNKLVPRKNGRLRASGHVTSGGDAIEYSTIYARAQFYGTNGKQVFRTYSTAGTGKRWDLKAKMLYGQRWGRTFARGMKL
jgi:hypothetical protein